MKKTMSCVVSVLAASAALVAFADESLLPPVGTAFTYQGQLQKGGELVDGPADFIFTLWTGPVGAEQVGGLVAFNAMPVDQGVFTVGLDFGLDAFNGDARWLQVQARFPAGGGAFAALTPRQPVSSAPYSLYALDAPPTAWEAIPGIPMGFLDGEDNIGNAGEGLLLDKVSETFILNLGPGIGLSRGQVTLAPARGPIGENQFLLWDGAQWNAASYGAGAGLTLVGTTFGIAPGGVVTGMLAPDSVTSATIANGAVANVDLANNSVDSAKIADGSVTSTDIADGTIANVDLANGAVNSAKIADGTVTSADIADATIANADLANNAVNGAKIADGTVTSADIADATIANADLANNAVNSAKIADGTVTSADITDATIANVDLANNAVNSAKIADGSITTLDIADGTIGGVDIGDGTISSVDMANNAIGATKLAADVGSIGKITTGAITTNGQFVSIGNGGGLGMYGATPFIDFHFAGAADYTRLIATALGELRIGNNNHPSQLVLKSGGRVGVRTDNPASDLEVNGTACKPGGGPWASCSDERLKKNIAPLEGALAKLLAIQGITFEYRDPEAIREPAGVRMGVIAQDVQQEFPEWVVQRDDGFLMVSFSGFEALTIEALRELDSSNQRLRDENDELRARLDRLEALVAGLTQSETEGAP